MSTLLQSSGKQYAQSPGRQRDAVGFAIRDVDANRYVFNKPTYSELLALLWSGNESRPSWDVFPQRALIPPGIDPNTGLATGGGFELPGNGIDSHDIYAESWDYLLYRITGEINHKYRASWPEAPILTAGAAPGVPDYDLFGYEPFLIGNTPLFAPILGGQNNPQYGEYIGHISHYRRLREQRYSTGQLYLPERFVGSRARFRTAFQVGEAWRATGRVEQVIIWTDSQAGDGSQVQVDSGWTFHDLTVAETFPVVPMRWYDVTGPWDSGDVIENTFSFVIYGETPAQWQERTGIPLQF